MKKQIFTLAVMLFSAFNSHLFGQNVGIGEPNPGSKLSVRGGVSIGSTYSTLTGPTGGIIIEGVMGIGTTSPDSNAILDIASSSKGIKFPKLTAAQRSAIHNPSKGLMLFDTDSNNVYYNDGSSWQSMVNMTQVSNLISGLTSTVTGLLGGGGNNGSVWYTGSGAPTLVSPVANTGDYYLASSTGNYYKKTSSLAWTLEGNLLGPAGATGAAGAAGATGVKGATGSNGATGMAGAAGANGANGVTGATGAQGPQGIQGVTGGNGADGATGPTGARGARGLVGADGPTGAQGIQGATGADGSNGAAGATGATGAQGPQGVQGVTGAAGVNGTNGTNGAAGATGAQGPQGIQGIQGVTGAAGAAGAVGAKGATGANGNNGATGATGPQGIQGVTGAAGSNGTNGAAGAQGPQGIQGVAGATGAQGPQGIQGIQGVTGAAGAAGAKGATGANGSNGATGANGSNGATGATGPQGIQGVTGAAGTNGANGAAGAQGPQGIQGVAGATGAQGPTGTSGGWLLTGNSINAGTNFIGTTNNASFRVKTNNTERFTVDSTGNVGIGTTAPSKALTVVSNTAGVNVVTLQSTSNTGWTSIDYYNNSGTMSFTTGFANPGTGSFFGGNAYLNSYGNDLVITNNSSSYDIYMNGSSGNIGIGTGTPQSSMDVSGNMALGSYAGTTAAPSNGLIVSGKVGIGNSSPSYQLDVTGTGRFTSALTIGSYTMPTANGSAGQVLTANSNGTASWTSVGGASGWSLTGNSISAGTNFIGTTNNASLRMRTNNAERFTIDSTGNVGIGSTSPKNKLDVNGGIAVGSYAGAAGLANGILVSGDVGIGTNGDYAPLTVQASGGKPVLLGGGSNTGSELKLLAFGAEHFSIYNNGQTNANGYNYMTFANTSTLAQSNTAGTSLMVIDEIGNVGIGTTSPVSTLDVNGGISVGSYAGTTEAPENSLIVSGSVGVGTSSPSSTFEIDGGFSTKINTITVSGNIYLDNSAWIWYFTGSGKPVLPSASGCQYRRYWIVNKTGSSKTISSYVPLSSSSSSTTLASYSSIEVVSDGSSWLQIK